MSTMKTLAFVLAAVSAVHASPLPADATTANTGIAYAGAVPPGNNMFMCQTSASSPTYDNLFNAMQYFSSIADRQCTHDAPDYLFRTHTQMYKQDGVSVSTWGPTKYSNNCGFVAARLVELMNACKQNINGVDRVGGEIWFWQPRGGSWIHVEQ